MSDNKIDIRLKKLRRRRYCVEPLDYRTCLLYFIRSMSNR